MLNLLALLTLAKAEKSRPETQRHRRRRSQWRRQTATQTRPGRESGDSPARAQPPPPQLPLRTGGISIMSGTSRSAATDEVEQRDST